MKKSNRNWRQSDVYIFGMAHSCLPYQIGLIMEVALVRPYNQPINKYAPARLCYIVMWDNFRFVDYVPVEQALDRKLYVMGTKKQMIDFKRKYVI